MYLQSQYLLRFCLILVFNQGDDGQKYLNNENVQFRTKLRGLTGELGSWIDESIQRIKRRLYPIPLENITGRNVESIELLKMKRFSMDILCHLTAITTKFQNIDQRMQSLETRNAKDKLLSILADVTQVKGLLSTCQEDFEVLELVHNRTFIT